MSKRIVIIGAGPAGLGAAWALHKAGYDDWCLYERTSEIGGLARSWTDEHGFTWDTACHVFYTKEPVFQAFLDEMMGDELVQHRRKAVVQIGEDFVPYPLQQNLKDLPRDMTVECLRGLAVAGLYDPRPAFTHDSFEDYLLQSFGEGLYDAFLGPYNKKLWRMAL